MNNAPRIMAITEKGQVIIPKDFRDHVGLGKNSLRRVTMEIDEKSGRIIISPLFDNTCRICGKIFDEGNIFVFLCSECAEEEYQKRKKKEGQRNGEKAG